MSKLHKFDADCPCFACQKRVLTRKHLAGSSDCPTSPCTNCLTVEEEIARNQQLARNQSNPETV